MDFRRTALVVITALTLVACGGGGGGGGGGKPQPPPDRTPVTPITPSPTPSASVSGKLLPSAAIDVDYDTNDPASGTQNNDDAPQPLNQIVTLHGFASKEPTLKPSDRFGSVADEFDIFDVSLQKDQLIQMQIVDWSNFDWLGTAKGDLDVYLVDHEFNLIASSESTEEFEQIIVPTTGTYYVVVRAYQGIAKYMLQLAPAGTGSNVSASNEPLNFVANEMIVKYKESSPLNPMAIAKVGNHRIHLQHAHQESARPTLAKIQQPQALAKALYASARQGKPAGFVDRWQQSNPDGFQKFLTLHTIKSLSQDPRVEYAEPNYIVQPLAVPNDRFYNMQWHYPLINLPQAWDITTGARNSSPVIVAVIDTGVVLGLPDMQGQVVNGYDFVSDPQMARDGDGIDNNPDDVGDSATRGNSSWHGSHVAGTVAARSNDQSGVAGVSWHAKIMPVRVLGAGGGTQYDIIQGILFAAGLANDSGTLPTRKADIINLSLGGPNPSQAYQNAMTAARNAGVIIIAAAGNNNSSSPFYPAAFPGVVSVSAVDLNREKAPYSNFGDTIDVAAPGGNIAVDLNGDAYSDGVLSTAIDDTSGTRKESFVFYNGTSMASPHIAGVIALMKAVYPGLTPDQVDALLQDGSMVDDIGEPGWDQHYGHGVVNALKSVQAAQRLADGGAEPTPNAQVLVNPTSIALGAQATTAQFRVSKQGTAEVQILRVSNTVDWLRVSPQSVDANGLGDYQIQVNRANLTEGYYQTTLSIEADNNTTLELKVTLQVGNVQSTGMLTQPYVFMLKASDYEVVATTTATRSGDAWSYQFNTVAEGEYYLVGSSDIDFNGSYCDSGETCGSYPSLNDLTSIAVTGNTVSNIDILMELGGLTNSTSAFSGKAEVSEHTGLLPHLKLLEKDKRDATQKTRMK